MFVGPSCEGQKVTLQIGKDGKASDTGALDEYNGLFSIPHELTLAGTSSGELVLKGIQAPKNVGFFKVNLIIGTKTFTNLRLELTCSDGREFLQR